MTTTAERPTGADAPEPPGASGPPDQLGRVRLAAERAVLGGCADAWTWAVFYAEGWRSEYDRDGRPRGWHTGVERERVEVVVLVPLRPGLPVHSLGLEPADRAAGLRPVFFRRRTVAAASGGGPAAVLGTVHCLGWETPLALGPVAPGGYHFCFEDGSTFASRDLNAV